MIVACCLLLDGFFNIIFPGLVISLMESSTSTSQDWESFEERVLLEPMPDDAESANAPAPNSSTPASADPAPAEQPEERDPPEVEEGKKR